MNMKLGIGKEESCTNVLLKLFEDGASKCWFKKKKNSVVIYGTRSVYVRRKRCPMARPIVELID